MDKHEIAELLKQAELALLALVPPTNILSRLMSPTSIQVPLRYRWLNCAFKRQVFHCLR